ncbi:hypothetical protein V493_03027 [Pseudogymnoascus sp. VKM F-4281 (FW-2241)]|nr:hypothetical protein V493_03027 [Pseudogymnoascus sp. VKM F-4281 (FW-2241)]
MGSKKLLRRFYEPLVLLHVLDPNGEQRIPRAWEDADTVHMQLRNLRRNFLNQLAYVCDYINGGDSVTAIALEVQPSVVTFWMASNSEVSTLTTSFLRGILKTLQGLDLTQSEDSMIFTEAEISQRCIEFSIRRVKTYHNFMQKYLRQCLATLRGSEDPEGE